MTPDILPLHPIKDSTRIPLFIETYGCQMNVNDSEVVVSLLQEAGYALCGSVQEAAVILVNTCSVRDNAEQRIWGRLDSFRPLKRLRPGLMVGVLGCMAERLKEQLLEHPMVNLVVGPDAYRSLPSLLAQGGNKPKQMDVQLSHKETYADIAPVRMGPYGVSAYISIMRGCNNMCAYCVVPYTRGAERSRDPFSIEKEARELWSAGYKEINLLGQNVDSYKWVNPDNEANTVNFAQLLEIIALIDPRLRVRFATSHPKDMGNGVLYTMAMYPNICRHIHLPVQSGSDKMLEKMNRHYTRQAYLDRIAKIREIIPDCSLSSDFIAGFCSETEEDHSQTLSIMEEVHYDQAFMFQYSERPNTRAARHYPDDVPLETKTRRLNEIIALQNRLSLESNQKELGKSFEVLIEGYSKRSNEQFCGRTSYNKMCVFPCGNHKIGDFVKVKVKDCSAATLIADLLD